MIKLVQLSSLEKIMPKRNQEFMPISTLCVLDGERASYQIAYCMDNSMEYSFQIESDIKEHLRVYKQECVPIMRVVHSYDTIFNDDNYISTEPGLYPDILRPLTENTIQSQFFYQGIWIETDEKVPVGKHDIKVTISNARESASTTMTLEVLNLKIPEQKINYWLSVHADCLASYYNVEVFSEEHWAMLEKFIKISAEYGSDMITPPIITPPVDTKVGGERPTVQLVDIYKDGDKYSFDFSKFERYIDMCHRCGITKFFMPQFFTQWGAKFTPKIEALEKGEKKRIFGWDVESTDERYFEFLRQFLPALVDNIKEQGIEKDVIFSISDEPWDDETIARYKVLYDFMKPYIKDFVVLDAMQNYEHYVNSGTDVACIPTNAIEDFAGKVKNICAYYCCAQDYKVSNRSIAAPSYRNRSFGYQLYKYDIKMFFHWALNFYYTEFSTRLLNPFYETDAGGGFMAGDAFSVYPGENGPVPSLRFIVFYEALQDLRVLELLETYIGRDEVIKLVEGVTGKITMENCAKSAKTILMLREKLITELRKYIR